MIRVEFDMGDTRKRLQQLTRATGITVSDVVNDTMRLACINAIKFTAPSGTDSSRGLKPSASRAKKQGFDRVEKDIRKVFINADNAELIADWDLVGMGAHAFRMQRGGVYAVDSDFYLKRYNEGDFRKHHERHRLPKSGRVTTARGGSESGRNTKNIGRWKFVAHVHARDKHIKRYIRLRQKKVGQLKAGWLPALRVFASRTHGKVVAPAWVKKQDKMGHVQGHVNKRGSGTVVAVNTVPYWSAKKREQVEGLVARIAQKTLNRTTQRQIDLLAKRFTEGRALDRAA